ncbi:cytochrome-c peroxidase [Arenibacter sp. BSSL-BM3]|uniref:Cytochrome-c peroxidase n=1 Tax=Arenibacter arenosicollis TaxID=2762274 RepID=A0ABR7QR93_9FLAO|nr:cytochrome c peroxidase [Arenibacter arenosicollis]MBC8769726.1 cytochrome-c peroxidase [Arenibacter arenosicollis]
MYVIFLSILMVGCGNSTKDKDRDTAKPKETAKVAALPKSIKAPVDNLNSKEKELLGKLLFYDPILSGGKDIACASCHHPATGYAEFLDLSIGSNGKGLGSKRVFRQPNDIPLMKRNSPTILNTAFNGIQGKDDYDPENAPMFWDDRVKSLEKQALEPIKTMEEMKGLHFSKSQILTEVATRLQSIPEYKILFADAFGPDTPIDSVQIGKAIAAFERTLVANNSRFDQYMAGDVNAISHSEKEGFELFKSVGCINCHNGPMFSDYKLHVLGVPENNKVPEPDSGFEESFAFRTASLRNLRFTAPYMHNGAFQNLKQVLEFYEDISFGKTRNPSVSKEMFDPFVRELQLSVKDMSLIISFLNTLNDDNFDKEIPEKVPSGLPVGGDIQ